MSFIYYYFLCNIALWINDKYQMWMKVKVKVKVKVKLKVKVKVKVKVNIVI